MGTLVKLGLALAAAFAIAWAGIATYDHVYDKGVEAERSKTETAEAKLVAMTDRALQAEETARHNEASALALGKALIDQADALDRHDTDARANVDRYAAALEAARAKRCPQSGTSVPGEVHSALTGQVTPEDAPLPASLKAAIRSLKKGRSR